MTFRQFAVNNVLRNKRLYTAYFLSSLFTVMAFFTFAMFAFHPAFHGNSINPNVMVGMSAAGGIIYVFSFFFVLYSMSAFLQSRKKEFGLLMIQGMSSGQIRKMVFMENMVIGASATVSGILFGFVFSKLILLLAENVLLISESLDFYLPWMAMAVTFVSFIILFLSISFFVALILRTSKLIELIKGDKKEKGEPKSSAFLSVLAALLLLSGYGIALYAEGLQVVVVMIPVILLVVAGTYLLFSQLSVFAIRRLKGKKSVFWRKTNMILFSDLSYRMKDNARAFFMVAIISTVAFSAIGALFGTHSYLTKGVLQANPFTFTYSPYKQDENVAKNAQLADMMIRDADIEAKMAVLEETRFSAGELGMVRILSLSDYNRAAALLGVKPLTLEGEDAIVVKQSIASLMDGSRDEKLLSTPVKLADGSEVRAGRMIETEAYPYFEGYYIVKDAVFAKLPEPASSEERYLWVAKEAPKEKIIAVGEKLEKSFDPGTFMATAYTVHEIERAYGPILFIGLFIGVVFFVSAGSFLYFRLYSDLDEDKRKFRMIAKMGLTETEMKKVVNRQTAILFFAPMAVALIHGAIALTALSNLFDYNLLTETTTVLAGFLAIQIIYFIFMRHTYIKQIRKII